MAQSYLIALSPSPTTSPYRVEVDRAWEGEMGGEWVKEARMYPISDLNILDLSYLRRVISYTFSILGKGHPLYATIRSAVGRRNYTLFRTTQRRTRTEALHLTYPNQRLPERTLLHPLESLLRLITHV
jgi:hypothetical protein